MKTTIKNIFITLSIMLILGGIIVLSIIIENPMHTPFNFATSEHSEEEENSANVADAYGIYDMITPELIGFYEENISKDNFLTKMGDKKIARMADKMGVDVQKMKACYILQDIALKTGTKLDIKDIAKYTDSEMVNNAKKYTKAYIDTLSDEEQKELKIKFKKIR